MEVDKTPNNNNNKNIQNRGSRINAQAHNLEANTHCSSNCFVVIMKDSTFRYIHFIRSGDNSLTPKNYGNLDVGFNESLIRFQVLGYLVIQSDYAFLVRVASGVL